MRKATILVVAIMTAVLIAAVALLAQSQKSILGTWEMNFGKSKYSPGPAPTSHSDQKEVSQGGGKHAGDLGPGKGQDQDREGQGKFEGKDQPVKGNNPEC